MADEKLASAYVELTTKDEKLTAGLEAAARKIEAHTAAAQRALDKINFATNIDSQVAKAMGAMDRLERSIQKVSGTASRTLGQLKIGAEAVPAFQGINWGGGGAAAAAGGGGGAAAVAGLAVTVGLALKAGDFAQRLADVMLRSGIERKGTDWLLHISADPQLNPFAQSGTGIGTAYARMFTPGFDESLKEEQQRKSQIKEQEQLRAELQKKYAKEESNRQLQQDIRDQKARIDAMRSQQPGIPGKSVEELVTGDVAQSRYSALQRNVNELDQLRNQNLSGATDTQRVTVEERIKFLVEQQVGLRRESAMATLKEEESIVEADQRRVAVVEKQKQVEEESHAEYLKKESLKQKQQEKRFKEAKSLALDFIADEELRRPQFQYQSASGAASAANMIQAGISGSQAQRRQLEEAVKVREVNERIEKLMVGLPKKQAEELKALMSKLK
jgi:hypothetical protein